MNGNNNKKAAAIAAAVTFLLALIILVLLFSLSLKFDREALADASVPEIQEEEPIYLEPEILPLEIHETPVMQESLVETPSLAPQTPSPVPTASTAPAAPPTPGEPDPAPVEQPQRVVNNPKPNPQPPVTNKPQLVASNKPSDVHSPAPATNNADEQRATSIAGKFKSADNNGSRNGAEAPASAQGTGGVSISGGPAGRSLIKINKDGIPLDSRETVVVSVQVTVNEDGKVVNIGTVKGGNRQQKDELIKRLRQSQWTPLKGAPDVSGTVTFTIKPK